MWMPQCDNCVKDSIENRAVTVLNKIERRDIFEDYNECWKKSSRLREYTRFYYKLPTCMNIVRE